MNSINLVINAGINANRYEMVNSTLKRKYLLKNVQLYNRLVARIEKSKGTFGTGYPFLATDPDFSQELPVIEEQVRYNIELIDHALAACSTPWRCADCLRTNGDLMPDLKMMCKPCPNVPNELKPRKVLNRLPDMDLWVVCDKENQDDVAVSLLQEYEKEGLYTSDNFPLKTIHDLESIVTDLENGVMPSTMLPLDSHIIDYETLEKLISSVPSSLREAETKNIVPYLPIHPLSYRKKWQYDDTSYNFIYDYLASFTAYDFDDNLRSILCETRKEIANRFSIDELYYYLLACGPKEAKARYQTLALRKRFESRIEGWKN